MAFIFKKGLTMIDMCKPNSIGVYKESSVLSLFSLFKK